MSDPQIPDATNHDSNTTAGKLVVPFPSLPALHTAHLELIRQHRESGSTPDLIAQIDDFIERGSATGILLDVDADRETAQGILDYWATMLYRDGHEPPDATLAEFDPSLAPELDDALCPYVGLDAFRERDHNIFFGRQHMIAELIERLKQHRLIAVVGPSGSGKSSLVRAGLIPDLHDDALPDSGSWRDYPPMVPGGDPLRSLARILRPAGAESGWLAEQVAGFKQDPRHLARLLAEAGVTAAVLVVDQFEEIFTLTEEEAARRAFIDNLLRLIDAPDADHTVILTMRGDFEPFVARVPELQARFSEGRVPVTPLSAAELREAIERPAALVGLKFETGVVDALLHDLLGEPAALPLLQFTLLKLWEHRQRNRVTLDAYKRLGGGRLALARSADEFYAGLIPEEQITARRILLRMVRPGEGLEVTSNRIRRSSLYQAGEATDRIDRVLEKLIGARLVRVTGGDTPVDEQIEVAHEALVRNWPTLVDWLEDERTALATRRRLEAKAHEWVRLGRGSSGLLDREQLIEAEHWLASPEASYLGFDPALPELVVWSRAAIEEAEQEREATRQRELEQARALAKAESEKAVAERQRADAERKRAELEERSNRRLTWYFRALAVTAIIAFALAILAIYQAGRAVSALGTAQDAQATAEIARRQAEDQTVKLETSIAQTNSERAKAEMNAQEANNNRETAVAAQETTVALSQDEDRRRRVDRANLLAAVSHAVLENRPQLSLLLAVEALRVQLDVKETPVPTATNALREVLIDVYGRGLSGHAQQVNSLAISQDGGYLLSGSDDRTARLWNLKDANPAASVVTLSGTTEPILAVAISSKGDRLIASDDGGVVHVWQTSEPTTGPRDLAGNTGPIKSLALSPDGKWLATSSGGNIVRVWNLDDLAAAPIQLARHTGPVTDLEFGGSGAVLLTAGADGVAYLWDLNGRNPEGAARSLNPRPNPLTYAALSRNGDWAAIAGEDGVTHLWRVSGSGFSSSRPIVLPTGTIASFAIDPRSRWVVIGGPDGTTRLWGLSSSRLEFMLTGHTGPVSALAFSADGSRLVTGSADGTARVWNLNDANPSAAPWVLRGNEGKINALALTPDGSRLATGSGDSSVHLWDLTAPPTTDSLPQDPEQLVVLACSVAGRNLTLDEWKLYFDARIYRETCGT